MDQSLCAMVRDAHSRRGSLAPLAAALIALAPLAFADGADASKKTKRIKLKRCKKQPGRCREAFNALCLGDPACDPLLACCDEFSKCNADAGLRCIFTPPETARQPGLMPRGLPPR